MIWILISVILAAVVLILLFRILSIRKSLKEIAADLHRILHTDTNSVITASSTDSAVRELAGALNVELKELRQARLQVENGTHELQTAVTNIAHDLRTPLTAISGYLELLERENHKEPTVRYLSVLRERTETLKGLTEDLFRYSVADTRAESFETAPVILNHELEIALAGAYQLLSQRGIVPEVCLPENAVERVLNKDALQRVFSNVLTNAAKYSAGDLSVVLHTDATIVFSNAVLGISEVEVGKMFDRFYTVENASNSTGLGLSIAKLLTKKMGGSIDAMFEHDILSICIHL